jgi:DNA-directed RNA polymerase specialized sigma subunit
MKFKLHHIRKSKAWQQLRKEGLREGADEKAKEIIESLLASGMTAKEIAERLKVSLDEYKRLVRP